MAFMILLKHFPTKNVQHSQKGDRAKKEVFFNEVFGCVMIFFSEMILAFFLHDLPLIILWVEFVGL